MTPATRPTLAIAAVAGLLATPFAAAAQHSAPAPAQSTQPTKARLSIDSPIADLAADPRIRAILDREVPAMIGHPHYPMFRQMSLREVAAMPMSRAEIGLDAAKAAAIQSMIDRLP